MTSLPRSIALIGFLLLLISHGAAMQSSEIVTMVITGELGEPGDFAVAELETKIRARGAPVTRSPDIANTGPGPVLLIGIPGRAVRLQDLVYSGKLSLPPNPESYTIRRLVLEGKPVTVVAGSDERGLMYALLEIARRVAHSPADSSRPTSILAGLPEATEKPAVEVRGMIQFLHNAELEKDWYYDREYWRAYLGMLAENRFNSFNLVFAHQTSYLAPPYPFLFSVEKYPQVKVPGLSEAEQTKNLETLQTISRMCRERGIAFIMGIWEHRAWTRGQTSAVTGLADEILVDYARLAMEKLLRLCPDISGIQLRVNSESGIANDQQTRFYRDGVIAGIKSAGRPVLLDLRGWGALPGTIDAVIKSGLPIRLSMKYWAEFMGMPYQAAQMLPSYSFADFLHYPRSYPVLYQLWSLGSHRLLPWGGVDWMKRFVPTTTLSDGLGFETCAPLSQKGFGNAPGNWRIFVSPQQESYRWEFQRYWLYYLLFGRLGYNPSAAGDLWMDAFRARFGEKAALPMFDAYQAASQVIQFLVSYRSSNPNMYIWPEKQMGGLLDFYIEVKPADEARFAGFDEYVARRLGGARSARMTPEEASDRLNRMAEATERALSRAKTVGTGDNNREFAANRIDFTVLALLARYHAQKIRAGAYLALFYTTGDETALRTAKSHAAAGLEIWQRLARLTDGVYYPSMVFGPRDIGHWKDNLVFVRHDTERLREVQEILDRYGLFELGLDFGPGFLPRLAVYEPQYGSSYSVERRFRLLNPEMTYTTQRGYGWRQVFPIKASSPMSIPYSSLEGDNLESVSLAFAVLYKDFLRGEGSATLLVDLPDGDYRVTAIVANQPELAQGSFRIRAAGQNSELSYAVAETGDKSMNVRVQGNRLELEFVPDGRDWLVSGLVIARRAPHIAHVSKASARPGFSLRLEATITAPDGVSSATLHYWPEGANQPVVVPMLSEGKQFTAELTPDRKWEGKNLSYFISARDAQNHESRAPGRGEFTVRVGSDNEAPVVEHKPVAVCEPGKALGLSFGIRDASNLETARLHYRHMTQTEKFQTVDLVKTGAQYEATIPGPYIGTRYDLMYYVEAVDAFGNGTFYPNPDQTSPYVVVRVRR